MLDKIQYWWRKYSMLGVDPVESYPERRRQIMSNHINMAVIIISLLLLIIDTIDKIARNALIYDETLPRESGFGYRFVLSIILSVVNLNLSANGYRMLSKLLLVFGVPYLYLILPLQVGPVYNELYFWYPFASIPFIVLPAMIFDFEKDRWIHVSSVAAFMAISLFSKELLDVFATREMAIQSIVAENQVFYRVAPAAIAIFAILCINYLIVLNDKNARKLDDKNKSLGAALEELKQAQQQLIKTEKLAVIGRMSSELTHEINTPISAIKANLSMLAYDQKHRLQLLKKIGLGLSEQALGQLSSLLKDMHEVSRSRTGSLQVNAGMVSEMEERIFRCESSAGNVRAWAKCLVEIGIVNPSPYMLLITSNLEKELIDFIEGEYQQRHSFKVSRQAISQAEKLVNKLKSMAYTDSSEQLSSFKLSAIVYNSLDLLENQMKSVQCELNLDADLPEISGRSDEILQVINNLIINALQAMDHAGELKIELTGDDANQQLTIEDSGGGIIVDESQDIFEAFFTTKGEKEGTGLGLHICKQIIGKHQGEIKWGNTGKGARFTVSLPV